MAKPVIEIYAAVERRDLGGVSTLLDSGVDVNASHPWEDGRLLDHAVCDPVDTELIRLLLRHGADTDARHPETGGTPMHQLLHATLPVTAILELVDLLIENGADINAVAEDREPGMTYTAVDIAVSGGPRMAALLEGLRARGGKPGPD